MTGIIMASKYYVVWVGRKPGIYRSWTDCKAQTDKFPAAKFKSFKTSEEADAAFSRSNTSSSKPKTISKGDTSAKPTKKPSSQNIKTYSASEIITMPHHTKIFTDGGCEPNPGQAGSGVAIYRENKINELWYGLYNPNGTNNTAELNALYQAQIIAQDEIEKGRSVAIFCDSQYCVKSITLWAKGWKKRDWKKKGEDIKNLELIKPMYELHQEIQDKVEILHVNGHIGVEGNELADRMSILAIEAQDIEFSRYTESLDIELILSMRRG